MVLQERLQQGLKEALLRDFGQKELERKRQKVAAEDLAKSQGFILRKDFRFPDSCISCGGPVPKIDPWTLQELPKTPKSNGRNKPLSILPKHPLGAIY